MPAPARAPRFPALFATAALLAALPPRALVADELRDERVQALQSSLPRYDPSIRTKALAAKAAPAGPKNAPAAPPANPPEPAQATTGQPAAPAQPATVGKPSADALELPKITVHPDPDVPKPRPRLTFATPEHTKPAEPFESASGREARLVKNHLTALDQALNSTKSNVARAKEAEHVQTHATQLNALADAVDTATLGEQDPALTQKIRAEFEKLYYTGPK